MRATRRPLTIAGRPVPTLPEARSWLVNEVHTTPRGLKLWYALLLVLLAVGGVAALISVPPGWEVMGTKPVFEWGLLIVAYVFFAIITSGLCLSASLGTVFGLERFLPFEKRHAILALISLTTAFIVIALELHYPIRMVFGAMLTPAPSSPMWWMGVFYGTYLVVLIVETWTLFTDHPVIHKYACTACAIVAVLAPVTLGLVFGVLAAKPFWYGIFTPIQMVCTALTAGLALLGIVFWAVDRFKLADHASAKSIAMPSIRLLLAIALVIVSALVVRQMVDALVSRQVGMREAAISLISGPLAIQFWGMRVIVGLVIPAMLLAMPKTRTPLGLLATSVAMLVGVFADRLNLVEAGQIYPRTTVGGAVSYPYASYTPSPVEIGILVFALAFFATAYTLAERYLRMGESDSHSFWPWPWIKKHHELDFEGVHDAGVSDPDVPKRPANVGATVTATD
ncbi:MAG: NrfD/PsrC family molybdoenzyme membrane anchor subunit [Chloroflexota bacterium]